MKILLSLLTAMSGLYAWAQTGITKDCLSTGGGSSTAGNTLVIFTLSETAVNESTQATVHLSEGFINPGMAETAGTGDYSRDRNTVRIFPNPATDYIRFHFPAACDYQIQLFDLQGHQIFNVSARGSENNLAVNMLPPGTYTLVVKNLTDKKFRVLKIIISR